MHLVQWTSLPLSNLSPQPTETGSFPVHDKQKISTISKLAIVPQISDSELGKNWAHCSMYEQWGGSGAKDRKDITQWDGSVGAYENYQQTLPSYQHAPPMATQPDTPVYFSWEHASHEWLWVLRQNRPTRWCYICICLYCLEYINWCESHANVTIQCLISSRGTFWPVWLSEH